MNKIDQKDLSCFRLIEWDRFPLSCVSSTALFIPLKYYISLSGPSQTLAEEFEKAARQLKKEAPGIRFGKVDVTDQKDLKKEFNIQEFPTVKFFVDGDRKNPIDCKGVREASAFITWVRRRIGPSTVVINSTDQAEAIINSEDLAVIGFFKVTQWKVKGCFACDQDPQFWPSSPRTIFPKMSKVENTIAVFKKVGTCLDIQHPAVFPFQIMFILVDTNETRNGRVFEYFRITEVDVPAVRILNLTSDAKYKMPADEVTVENLRRFCHSYLGGKAKPHVSSEEIPEDWDKNPVKVLVGKNFNKVTFNKTKNVFVMFYAPWSHDCRKLLPIWDELGKKYENHENIVIAKIDFTANDIQLVMLDRYPFFRFFPVGSNNQVRSIQCVGTLIKKILKTQTQDLFTPVLCSCYLFELFL
uniref:Protein disulfide isomerase like, testis expressed n=1 Tax=Chelydra serpentina TaxID=8475 RepID=A0A8C3XUE0_CHESE